MAAPLPIVSLIALALVGCTKADTPAPSQTPTPAVAPPPSEPPKIMQNIALTWTAAFDKQLLRVTYKIENHSDAAIFVADKLLHGGTPVDRLVVMNGAADTIRLVRGLVMPDAERVTGVEPAVSVKLDAKASLERTVELPLPLVAWNNFGATTPLKPAKAVVLEVSYATSNDDDAPVTWLRGEPQPMPVN